jgi:hypothetical protein
LKIFRAWLLLLALLASSQAFAQQTQTTSPVSLGAGASFIGNVGAFPTPATNGALSWYNLQPTASTNANNIKASAGVVYNVAAFNNSATINYLRLYNVSGAPTCTSATNLVYQQIIPATTVAAAVVDIPLGITFSTGIGICVTAGYGGTDSTVATASALLVNVGYK